MRPLSRCVAALRAGDQPQPQPSPSRREGACFLPPLEGGARGAAATKTGARAFLAIAITLATPAIARDKITLGLDWRAEAEYAGFYQAQAAGLYAAEDLDVSIREGGPQVNQTQLLLAGRLDCAILSNGFLALNLAQEKIPFRAVFATFQKDPSVILAHPGQGNDTFEALRGKPIFIGSDTRAGWWNFARQKFGFSDAQIRPYGFSLTPFLTNKAAIQQGYLASEPYLIEQATGEKPVVLLLADAGFDGYGSLIATSDALIKSSPTLIRRFLSASARGWASYLTGDPTPANAAIRAANPEMTDGLLAYAHDTLRDRGIVASGDAQTLGIGAMTDARWQRFTASMRATGLYPATLDPHGAYTLEFVGKP